MAAVFLRGASSLPPTRSYSAERVSLLTEGIDAFPRIPGNRPSSTPRSRRFPQSIPVPLGCKPTHTSIQHSYGRREARWCFKASKLASHGHQTVGIGNTRHGDRGGLGRFWAFKSVFSLRWSMGTGFALVLRADSFITSNRSRRWDSTTVRICACGRSKLRQRRNGGRRQRSLNSVPLSRSAGWSRRPLCASSGHPTDTARTAASDPLRLMEMSALW